MARVDELRLLVRVARLYYEQGMRQPQIAVELGFSQATVSRLLQRAQREGVVRISVSIPPGVYPELEEALKARFALRDAVVADTAADDEAAVVHTLGTAAARYIETTLKPGDVVGVPAWSAALSALLDAMHPLKGLSGVTVVQTLGAGGAPAETNGAPLARRLAELVGGSVTLLNAPGVVGSPEARRIILSDECARPALDLFDRLTLALVGIGALPPAGLSLADTALLRERGAVGDVCLRFFNAAGRPVTALDDRVIGIAPEQLRRVPRVVGVAGSRRKLAAVRGALAGGWVSVLVTDRFTAERLLADDGAAERPSPRPASDAAATAAWLD